MTSNLFKCVIAFLLSSFIPFTIAAFLLVRRTKKQVEFDRVVHMLYISATEGEFARDRVAELREQILRRAMMSLPPTRESAPPNPLRKRHAALEQTGNKRAI